MVRRQVMERRGRAWRSGKSERAEGVEVVQRLEPRLMLSGWIDTSDRTAVSNFYNTQYMASEGVPAGWTGSLTTGDPGTTTAAFKDAVLQRVNYYRSMAGVPAITSMDATYSQEAQSAALMMSANDDLSHSPPSSWTFYTAAGAEAAANSDLTLGAYGPDAIDRYMADSESSNTAAGHRRWILYPQTQVMGTGDVPGAVGYYPANALWIIDNANIGGPRPATRTPYVAWPSPGFVPYQVMPTRWSFSYADASFDSANVTLTRNGSPVSLTVYATEDGYGENSLVWDVPGAITSADTQYTVTLTDVVIGGVPQTFTYSVTSFSPVVPNSAPTDIALSANTIAGNQPAGTVVGSLSTTDPDAGDTFTYSLVSGTGSDDNASFTISGNQLLTAASFSLADQSTYSIRVRTTDSGGLTFEKAFTITVEAPPIRGSFGMASGKVQKLPLPDAAGDIVTLTLTGGGTGQVLGAGTNFDQIVLSGTTASSVLSLSIKKAAGSTGMVAIGGISCAGLLKSVNATAVILSGGVQINTLNQIAGKASLSLKFDQITDAEVTVQGLPVASIAVGGTVSDSRIVSTGSIGKFTAAALLDSDVLVGVAADFTGQFAGSAGDFSNTAAKLTSLTVAGKKLPKGSSYPAYVSGVYLSAPSIGTLKLANVDSTAGEVQANVLADTGTLTITALNPMAAGVSVLAAGTWKPGKAGRPAVITVV